jgi:Fic family protein
MHPVILAAEIHERLVSIHPFIDGNGRTARLLMNFILLKHGFTIAILKGDLKSRLQYYKCLEEVQMENNPVPFYKLIISKVRDSLKEHLELT